MALEACSLWLPNPAAISNGLSPLANYYAGPHIHFNLPYPAVAWLPLLPAPWMYALASLLLVFSVLLALGAFSRLASVSVFLIWGYFFAVESTRTYWQSHYYLETLVLFLLIWMPTGRRYGLDALWLRRRGFPRTVPFWTVFLLRGQLVIAYFYAGVAKLNADWLLDAVPVRWFLANPAMLVPYRPYLNPSVAHALEQMLHSSPAAYFFSYAGLVFDLLIGFLLIMRRTRVFAMVLMLAFHATNHLLIFDDISWFPLLGATTALIFLDVQWPDRLIGRLTRRCRSRGEAPGLAAAGSPECAAVARR